MAIDPFPSKKNDPTWTDFAGAHDLTKPATPIAPAYQPPPVPQYRPPVADPVTGRPRPMLPEIDVAAMVRLVEQTQAVQSAIVHPEPAKLPAWTKSETAKTAAWVLAVPTLVTGCANISAHQWGPLGPSVTAAAISLLCTVFGISGLNHHWAPQGVALMLGIWGGAISFAIASSGSGWSDVLAWLFAGVGTLGFKIVWNRKHAESKAKVDLIHAKTRTETIKGDSLMTASRIKDSMSLLKVQQLQHEIAAAQAAAATPVVLGATAEEIALRKAFWDVFHVSLTSCDVRFTKSGWAATLGVPVELPRDAAISGWNKVESALRSDGRFIVDDGHLSNEIDVRYVRPVDLSPQETLWYPGRLGIGVCTVTGEIVDVPVEGQHSMTGGQTNMGKSAYARIQLMRTCPDPYRAGVVIDPKRAEAVAWKGKLRVAGADADLDKRYDDIYDTVCELMSEFRHRQTLFPGLYWEASEEYPTLFITIDEGAALKRMAEIKRIDFEGKPYKPYGDVLDMVETLFGEARVVGMWLNYASQYLDKGSSIPKLVKENVGATVGLTTLGPEGDRMLFGEQATAKNWSPSEYCSGIPGRAMVRYRDRKSYPLQLWHVTGEHIAALPDAEPWRSRAHRTPGKLAETAVTSGFEGDPREEAQHLRDVGEMSIQAIADHVGMSKAWVLKYTEKS